MTASDAAAGAESGPAGEERFWTVPNAVCVVRALLIVPLLWCAWEGRRTAFAWILGALLVGDWLDGKLAILLDQRTEIGARLDSFVDWAMYAAVGLSFWWMEGEVLRDRLPWLVGVGGSWLAAAAVALVRFGRPPSYHTRAAKASWLVAGVAAFHLLLTGSAVTLPWAFAAVVLTNLEAVGVGLALPGWRTDVAGLRHALRIRREEEPERRARRDEPDRPGDQP